MARIPSRAVTTPDPILKDIEVALDLHNLSATRFSYVVMGDPSFVMRLRKGRRVQARTRERVAAALAKLKKEGEL